VRQRLQPPYVQSHQLLEVPNKVEEALGIHPLQMKAAAAVVVVSSAAVEVTAMGAYPTVVAVVVPVTSTTHALQILQLWLVRQE
jgi:hypothetical protein